MIAIPVRDSGPSEPESLRYVLRSIATHLPGESVTLVGHRPSWYRGPHIPTHQIKGVDKHVNIGTNLVTAARTFDRFCFWSDDCVILRPSAHAVYARPEPIDSLHARLRRSDPWTKTLGAQRDLLHAWGFDTSTIPCGDSHHPILIRSELLQKVLERTSRDNPNHPVGSFRALYAAHVRPVISRDPKATHPAAKLSRNRTYVSLTPITWRGQPGADIRALFPDPGPLER